MKKLPPFENKMSRGRLIAGLVYLPIHIVLLPLFLPLLLVKIGITDLGMINVYYYSFSLLVMLVIFLPFLRANFDPLVDNFLHCLISFLMALGIYYVLSVGVNALVLSITEGVDNPNDQAIMELVELSGALRAAVIFIGPIVEEILFRGVIFGGVHRKSRVGAYVLSIAMFSLCHVWQYALMDADWTVLIYILQYIPPAFALAWSYERSRSIWVPIGFHMMINAMGLAAEKLLAEMG